jgi:hypothetical protein
MAEASVDVQASGLVVGPDDLLVINLGPGVTRAQFEEMADLVVAGHPQMKGRLLVLAVEQIAVVQGAREPT